MMPGGMSLAGGVVVYKTGGDGVGGGATRVV